MKDDRNPFDAALRGHATRHNAPAGLRERIRANIAAETARAGSAEPWWRRGFNFRSAAAGFAMGALCTVFSIGLYLNAGSDDNLGEELVNSHVRAMLTNHLTDVVSSDRHTVKPWFSTHLDFSPPVWNERPADFPLIGGRVDYLHGRAVAALVYKRNAHVINVFVWPESGIPYLRSSTHSRNGYQSLRWTDAGMQFWAVSDVSAEELLRFREMNRVVGDERKNGSKVMGSSDLGSISRHRGPMYNLLAVLQRKNGYIAIPKERKLTAPRLPSNANLAKSDIRLSD